MKKMCPGFLTRWILHRSLGSTARIYSPVFVVLCEELQPERDFVTANGTLGFVFLVSTNHGNVGVFHARRFSDRLADQLTSTDIL